MLKEIFNTIDTTYEGYKNLRTFFTSVFNGEFKNRDAEINKRFQQYESKKSVAPEAFNPKLESMEHSQGVSGFAGSGYKGAGKAQADKSIHNRARNH